MTIEEKLEHLLSGEHQIDIEFREKLQGKILKAEEIEDIKNSHGLNYLRPAIKHFISMEGLTETQILKAICLGLQKIIEKV